MENLNIATVDGFDGLRRFDPIGVEFDRKLLEVCRVRLGGGHIAVAALVEYTGAVSGQRLTITGEAGGDNEAAGQAKGSVGHEFIAQKSFTRVEKAVPEGMSTAVVLCGPLFYVSGQ